MNCFCSNEAFPVCFEYQYCYSRKLWIVAKLLREFKCLQDTSNKDAGFVNISWRNGLGNWILSLIVIMDSLQ